VPIITRAHMNLRELYKTPRPYQLYDYAAKLFVDTAFPETDDEAKRFIPQTVAAQKYYNDRRDEGETIRQALMATLMALAEASDLLAGS
jgi:hypothetical protein